MTALVKRNKPSIHCCTVSIRRFKKLHRNKENIIDTYCMTYPGNEFCGQSIFEQNYIQWHNLCKQETESDPIVKLSWILDTNVNVNQAGEDSGWSKNQFNQLTFLSLIVTLNRNGTIYYQCVSLLEN